KWRYMSPEQSRGEPLRASSDLFSTASLMFELFTGRRLFDQDAPEEIVEAIRYGPIPQARALRPELPDLLDEILAQGLERNPDDRSTAAALGRSLVELSYAQSLPVTAADLA